MPHVNCQTVELEEWWFGGFCSQRTWAPYRHCVDHVLFCLLPQAPGSSLVSRTGPLGMAEVCSALLWLPFGLDAPSGGFFLLLLGLACSCHWDVWHWSFSTHTELYRVWVSWVFRSLPLTLGGASFSVKGTHTQTVMQDCSCVSDFLFRFFWGADALYFLHLHFLTQAFGLIFADIVKYVACCLSSELVIDCVLVFFLFSFLYLNHWGTKRRGDDGYMFKLATHGNQGKNSLVFVSVKINNSIQNCLQQTGKWAKDDWRTVQQTMGGSNFYVLFSVCVIFLKFVFIVSMFFICCFVCFYFKKSVLISYPQLPNQGNDQHLFSHLL